MDYTDENESPVLSIAFDDDETKNVLVVGVAQDANVKRVVVGPAVGRIETLRIVDDQLNNPQQGQQGFLVAECTKGDVSTYAALTQDGRNVLTAIAGEYSDNRRICQLLNRQTPVYVTSLLKLSSAAPAGQITDLPKILIELASYENNAMLKINHAPAEETFDGATATTLFKSSEKAVCYWGDEVTQLYVEMYN